MSLSVYFARLWRRLFQHRNGAFQGRDQIKGRCWAAPQVTHQHVFGANPAPIDWHQNTASQLDLYSAIQGAEGRGEVKVNDGGFQGFAQSGSSMSSAGQFARNCSSDRPGSSGDDGVSATDSSAAWGQE